MQLSTVVKACTAIICTYAEKPNLCEFELLAYEQACRTLESVLRDFREAWELTNEPENYSQ